MSDYNLDEEMLLAEEEQSQNDDIDLKEGDDEVSGEDGDISEIEEETLIALAGAQLNLQEGTKIIRLTKDSQLANLSGRAALILARRANDPLYTKYAHFNSLRLELKKRINAKYGSKSVMYARKLYAEAQRRQQSAPAAKR